MSSIGLLSLAALWLALEPTVTLQSDTACPSAEAVDDALVGLGVREKVPAVFVKVHGEPTGLVVELVWPDNPQAQYRRLPLDGDCAARARAAAVVVAVWLGSLPTTSLSAPVVEPTNAPTIGTPLTGTSAARTPARRAARWVLGLGVGAGTSGDLDVAPALLVEGTRRLSSWVGLAVTASASGPHHRTVGPGTSSFVRPTMTLAGRMLLPMGATHVAFDAGLAGGLTVAWGTDYPSNDMQHAFGWGPAGGLRVLLGAGRVKPWLAARLMYWVRSQRLHYDDLVTGSVTAKDVSPIEGSLTVGCDLELL